MHRYFIINKPYNMLSQFTAESNRETLADLYNFPHDVYPVGRLDADSEGLLILTNDRKLNHQLLNPNFRHKRTYLVQVEGDVSQHALSKLEHGVVINVDGVNYQTLPAKAEKVAQPGWLYERNPPVRFRKTIPTSFITLTIYEGKNRQVRKMTAAAGFPTLRLIRTAIENLVLDKMKTGEVREMTQKELFKKLGIMA